MLGKKSQGKDMKWPADDGCNDYWETIAEILRNNTAEMIVKWMPSHLDEPNKDKEKAKILAEGGCASWIDGNCGADDMAKKGAELAAPPRHLLAR
jgi:hypothetical protein